MPPETIAHYRVGPKLGEGGMGEVYRAIDTKLQREVALKLLPEAFTEDAERLERFRHEARSLAALSHPNIGAIHGIEEDDGRAALVLELIEGPTLADRLDEGPLPVEEACGVALQIAAALEAAHERGIVHRDLKPANVKITPEGQVKVLDFGLAKSVVREETAAADVTRSPTVLMTSAATPGVVMGTAAYMAPEQAKGQAVDRRVDIWAYGAVLTEMLTGRRLFDGDDVTEVLAAVISTEPDLNRLPGDTPRVVRDLIERCLRRDVSMRLPDIGVARIALQELAEGSDEAIDAAPGRRPAGGLVAAIALGALLVGWLAGSLGGGRDTAPTPASATSYLELMLDPPPLPIAKPAISPDGRAIAYAGNSGVDQPMVYLRSLDDGSTRAVPGSENGNAPSFSADGRSLVFIAAGQIKVAVLGGGLPEPVASFAGTAEGTVWLPDDTLVFAALGSPVPLVVPAAGGLPRPIEVRGIDTVGLRVSEPSLLPDAETLLVSFQSPTTAGPRVGALSLRDGTLTSIARGSSPSFVEPDTLVFLQRDGLVVAPFDTGTLALTGPERALSLSGISLITLSSATGDRVIAGISPRGLAVFPLETPETRQLVWVDRSGNETPAGFTFDALRQSFAANGALGASLSADARWVTLIAGDTPLMLDLTDLSSRRTLARPGPSIAYPRFTPDGEHVTLIGNATGEFHGYLVPTSGQQAPRRFTETPQSIPTSFFPDGKSMLGYIVTPERARDLWVFGLDGNHTPLLQTPANERAPMLSPDGRAFAYVSDESGEDRIYVRLYPDVGRAWRVSEAAAGGPLWSRDGSELYYIQGGWMMAATVDLTDGVRLGVPEPLFPYSAYEEDPFSNAMYDVAEDGRFILVRRGAGVRLWRWIQNWGAELAEQTAAR